jgi:hypothetical protein
MIFSRIFVYTCLFLVIFVFIPLVHSDTYKDFQDILDGPFFVGWKGVEEDRPSTSKRREYKCSCCGVKNDHYKPKCPHKNNCSLHEREDELSISKSREYKYKCSCCGAKNDHYKPKCPHKNNCPSHERKDELIYTSRKECFFGIEAKKFVKRGERIPSNCRCAKKGDEQCHGIADVLSGPGNCENCFSCSREMNIKMMKMENFVKKSDGGIYFVSCDDSKYAKTILQFFEQYNGVATSTVISRESPTNLHYEL